MKPNIRIHSRGLARHSQLIKYNFLVSVTVQEGLRVQRLSSDKVVESSIKCLIRKGFIAHLGYKLELLLRNFTLKKKLHKVCTPFLKH